MRPDASVVAAVVVSYKSGGYLERCLRSLVDAGVPVVVVVENGTDAGTEAEARASGADWIEAGDNLGYGRAANLGAGQAGVADADYLLICNSDIEIEPGSVDVLTAALDTDPSIGAVGPRILNPDGTLYPSARTFPNMVDAMGHGLFGLVAPGTASPGGTGCSTGTMLGRPRSAGSPAPASSSGERRGTRYEVSIRRSSCTWRTWTCAGG